MFIFSSKFNIDKIHGYEILDSRGFPTVACEVILKNGLKGKAMVPSGASTGVSEAIELRDNDKNRFNGKGVLNAINNINNILAPYLYNCDPTKQSYIDKKMIEIDGTPNKSKLGANAILAVSLACANVSAKIKGLELYEYIRRFILKDKYDVYTMPLPMLNVINGGAHANNSLDFQEFMFVPVGAKNFRNALRISSECFYSLQKILIEKKQSTGKGDEGGFAPNLKNHVDALELMTQAIKQAGYHPGVNKDVAIALDCAASELYDQSTKKYIFSKAIANKVMDNTLGQKDSSQMIAYLKTLVEKFPIISIEDGLAESDWAGFAKLTATLGKKVQIVGDDLYCTNIELLKKGIESKSTNAILIKLNQIGTLTETINTVLLAKKNNLGAIISHRSGETEDTSIADLAVALDAKQIKTGSVCRSERTCKYNRLFEIEDSLYTKSKFDGVKSLTNIEQIASGEQRC